MRLYLGIHSSMLACTAVIFLLLPSSLLSQSANSSIVRARIMDSESNALPYANFVAYTVKDTTLVLGAASDMDGRVSLELKPGNYLFKIGFLAFKDLWIGPSVVGSEGLRLGPIILQTDIEQLQAVEITGERSQMELYIDKRVINVQQDLSNRGKNAAEILDNIPSVSVSVEGDVSLRGNENVRILVNGKPSGLTGISGNSALRQLQGDLIESIEVITNPSAKYEAQGEVGIINIILKKDQGPGINGSVDLTAGYPSLYGGSGNINWRRDKWNVFSSLGFRNQENPGFGTIDQRFFTADTSYSFVNERKHRRGGNSFNFRLGTEWNISEYWSLTFSGLVSKAEGNNTLNLTYDDFDESGQLTRSSSRHEDETEDTENLEFDLNLVKTFSVKDRKWTFDIKRALNEDLESSIIDQDFSDQAGDILKQRSSNAENSQNLVLQTDYIHPFGTGKKFETGLRTGLRTIQNDFQVEQFEDVWTFLPDFTNDLRYDEWITAGYGIFSSEKNKWAYQLGLRAEYSDIRTELLLTQEKNPRSYLNLFPSAFLTYKSSPQISYQLNYSRRIDRPRFWFLIPFYGYGDSRNFFAGNPDLNPEYSHNLELNRLGRSKKGSFMTSVYARFEDGIIQRVTFAGDTGTYTYPINLGNGYSLGAEISGTLDITEIWKLNGSVNAYFNDQNGFYEGLDYSFSTWAWNGRLNNKLEFKEILDFQASLRYRSGQDNVQGRQKSITSLDLATSRDVFKGKGTLTFNLSDVFNSRTRRSVVEQPGYYSENTFQWRSRLFSVSLNYRINQKKGRENKRDYMDGEDMGG